ncbi:MAG: chorismate synthase, partial [SAR324 cluster bacterium]|nr:chorismate synthase [SAR324 cluster bacterium]
SHADYTYEAKYGFRNWMGGGRASARETIGRVAAGALAKKLLKQWNGTLTLAWVEQIHDLKANVDHSQVTEQQIEQSIVRCPDTAASNAMEQRILEVRKKGDSVGGIIRAVSKNVPVGLGEPVFDKLTADLAKALMSLPATRGVEFGLGFQSVSLMGSEHNDEYVIEDGNVKTRSNRSAGIQGGISNGEEIDLRIAFKPTATINHEQKTVTREGESTTLSAKGRHDPCVLPRAVPMVEAMINLVLADHYLRQQSSQLH